MASSLPSREWYRWLVDPDDPTLGWSPGEFEVVGPSPPPTAVAVAFPLADIELVEVEEEDAVDGGGGHCLEELRTVEPQQDWRARSVRDELQQVREQLEEYERELQWKDEEIQARDAKIQELEGQLWRSEAELEDVKFELDWEMERSRDMENGDDGGRGMKRKKVGVVQGLLRVNQELLREDELGASGRGFQGQGQMAIAGVAVSPVPVSGGGVGGVVPEGDVNQDTSQGMEDDDEIQFAGEVPGCGPVNVWPVTTDVIGRQELETGTGKPSRGPKKSRSKSKIEPLLCGVCGEGFETSIKLDWHLKRVHLQISPSYSTGTKIVVDIHGQQHGLSGVNPLPQDRASSRTGGTGTFYLCLCGKRYFGIGSFRGHLWASRKKGAYKCPMSSCRGRAAGRGFVVQSDLDAHLRNVHKTEYVGDQWACCACSAAFPDLEGLMEHRMTCPI